MKEIVIKKYKNNKFYVDKGYITLAEIKFIFGSYRTQVRIIDQVKGEDITFRTLAAVVATCDPKDSTTSSLARLLIEYIGV